MRDWIIAIISFFLIILFGYKIQAQENPKVLVYYYSFEVRIVLTDIPCDDNQGWRAAAQRIDKIAIPACWIQDPANPKNVKINWNNGDFSVFEMEKFKPFTE